MNFSFILTLNYLHPIHYEYIYPVHFVLDKFSNSISSTTKSSRTKKFYSPFFPRLFLHARSLLPPVAVRHRVKKSVERENSAKNPSIFFPSFVSSIHSQFEKSFDQRFPASSTIPSRIRLQFPAETRA